MFEAFLRNVVDEAPEAVAEAASLPVAEVLA